jgi:pilus assembly protein Flp/PilA
VILSVWRGEGANRYTLLRREVRLAASSPGVFSRAKALSKSISKGKPDMQIKLWKLYAKLNALMSRENGQDLIEYALVVALIAFAATAGMTTIATDINTAFTNIGSSVSSLT